MDIKEQLKQYSYLREEQNILEESLTKDISEELKAIYVRKKEDIQQTLIDIENIIDKIEDSRDRDIIRKKYVQCKTWETICVEMNYSYRGLQKIHSTILQELRKKSA